MTLDHLIGRIKFHAIYRDLMDKCKTERDFRRAFAKMASYHPEWMPYARALLEQEYPQHVHLLKKLLVIN